MVLDWLGKSRQATIPALLARKQYARAVELAQAELRARPGNSRLRLQLADTLVVAGRGVEAVPLLSQIASDLAADGFAAKAIAILKRIQKISPGRSDVDERLAGLIHGGRTTVKGVVSPAPELGMDEIGFEPSSVSFVEPAIAADEPPDADAEVEISLEEIAEQGPSPATAVTASPLFPDFSKEELLAVMRGLELMVFAPGDVIVAQGQAGDSLFLLSTGTVKAWMRDKDGRYVLVRELREGDFFGEISILTGKPRTATITAATHCELLELDRPALDSITVTYPHVREVLERFHQQRAAVSVDSADPRSGSA